MTITVNLWWIPPVLWTVFVAIGARDDRDWASGLGIWLSGLVLMLTTRFLP